MTIMNSMFPDRKRCAICHALKDINGRQKHREGCTHRKPTRQVAYDTTASINVTRRRDRFRAKNSVIGRNGQ